MSACGGANPGNPEHPKSPATGVLLTGHLSKRGSSVSAGRGTAGAAELPGQSANDERDFVLSSSNIFLAELHQ